MASEAVIRLGFEWKDRRKGKPVTFDPERQGHFELLAPPGCGKGVSLEIPTLLLGLRGNVSVFSIDPSGQNAAVCAEARRSAAKNDVLCLNPYGLHVGRYPDLQSVGFNPLAGIDHRSFVFLQDCQAVGEALIRQQGNDPHWSDSARGLITGIIMWEVVKAIRERRAPLLENVRSMLCEPEAGDEDGNLTAGLRFHAGAMIDSGHWQIGDLAGRFVKEGSREIDSIISTARTQTEWLLSEPMRSDLRKNGIGDWARLLDRRTTCFVIVPAEYLESQEGSVWMRLVILAALRALYARAGRRKVKTVVFMLSEFAGLGKLSSIETARSQGRKYGVRLFLVLQDIHQLRTPAMYGPQGHESFAGQCGGVFAFAPGDFESAEWMSRRSGEELVKVPSLSQNDQGATTKSWSWQRQRCWSPDDILGLPEYHGLLWLHGQSRAVPVYAQPYFDDPACLRLARPDPYQDHGGDYDALPPPAVDLYQHVVTPPYRHAVTARSQLSIGHSSIAKLPPPANVRQLPDLSARLALPPPASSSVAKRGFGKGIAAALVVAAGLAAAGWALSHPVPVDPPKVDPPAQHHPAKHVTRR